MEIKVSGYKVQQVGFKGVGFGLKFHRALAASKEQLVTSTSPVGLQSADKKMDTTRNHSRKNERATTTIADATITMRLLP